MTSIESGAAPVPTGASNHPPFDASEMLAEGGRADPQLLAAVAQALRSLTEEGYVGSFSIEPDAVWCVGCRARQRPTDVRWSRVEVVGSGAGVAIVGGLTCPACGAHGTAWRMADRSLGRA